MISDSAYDVGDLIMRPVAGLATGFGAAAVMLLTLDILQGFGAVDVWLRDIGNLVMPWQSGARAWPLLAGLVVHFAVGAVLGALHAACQQRAPAGGLVVVGAFYGFILWLASDVVLVRWLGLPLELFRTWSGVLVMVVFGLTLGAWAGRIQSASSRLRPAARPVD